MTCAVSAAVREGAEAVICASTGNTAASAAAYAARAGLTGAVIVPEGKIATGKLAQALMHGARVVALRGNFDEALALVRELAERHPIALVNSVNPFRLEGQKTAAFELVDELGDRSTRCASRSATPATSPRTGRASSELGARPADARLPGRGRGAARRGAPVEQPGDDRQRDPDRQPRALGGGDGGDDRLARRDPRGHRRGDPRRLPLPGRATRACSASRRRPPGSPGCCARRRGRRRVVCVLTGHGLKDPQTALGHAGAVVPCEPELAAVERAVLR